MFEMLCRCHLSSNLSTHCCPCCLHDFVSNWVQKCSKSGHNLKLHSKHGSQCMQVMTLRLQQTGLSSKASDDTITVRTFLAIYPSSQSVIDAVTNSTAAAKGAKGCRAYHNSITTGTITSLKNVSRLGTVQMFCCSAECSL
eukprot:GHRR01031250.1.p1 GENE.GHRR01031250.1~~GHRR01031250.1.p1  ORF type:complete len:141 (-),score=17.69 GHRR01031250.1:1179-1601(-)